MDPSHGWVAGITSVLTLLLTKGSEAAARWFRARREARRGETDDQIRLDQADARTTKGLIPHYERALRDVLARQDGLQAKLEALHAAYADRGAEIAALRVMLEMERKERASITEALQREHDKCVERERKLADQLAQVKVEYAERERVLVARIESLENKIG